MTVPAREASTIGAATDAEILEAVEPIPGWMTPPELKWLTAQARQLPSLGVWVEIGTYMGRSFYAVAKALPPQATLICIDSLLWSHVVDGYGSFRKTFDRVLTERPDLRFVTMQEGSYEAARFFQPEAADLVFIDGSHEYADVCDDIRVWTPMVRPGGILSGHDYQPPWPGVIQAVDEAFGDAASVVEDGTIWHTIGKGIDPPSSW